MRDAVDPLWLECYAMELPLDAGMPNEYVFHSKGDVLAPIEQGWASGADPPPRGLLHRKHQ